jgi:hypothetical protein
MEYSFYHLLLSKKALDFSSGKYLSKLNFQLFSLQLQL